MAGEPNPGALSRAYDRFAAAAPPESADVIFVLAGRYGRKSYGLKLWKDGWAGTLLLSVDRFEIRRFSTLTLPAPLNLVDIAFRTEPRQRHYFVEIQNGKVDAQRIAVGRFGTWAEVVGFSDWLRVNGQVRSAMVVSSGFHLRRVRMCCRKLVGDGTRLTFVAVPDESRYFRRFWWRNAKALRLVLSEFVKIGIYWGLCHGWMSKGQPEEVPV